MKHKNRKIRMTQMSHAIPWLQPGGSSQSREQQFRAQRLPPARCRRWRGERERSAPGQPVGPGCPGGYCAAVSRQPRGGTCPQPLERARKRRGAASGAAAAARAKMATPGVGCAMRKGSSRAARRERGGKPHRGTRRAAEGRAALGPGVGESGPDPLKMPFVIDWAW